MLAFINLFRKIILHLFLNVLLKLRINEKTLKCFRPPHSKKAFPWGWGAKIEINGARAKKRKEGGGAGRRKENGN